MAVRRAVGAEQPGADLQLLLRRIDDLVEPDDLLLQVAQVDFGARVRFATGQLENTAKLRLLRRDIARLETVLREKQAGVSR